MKKQDCTDSFHFSLVQMECVARAWSNKCYFGRLTYCEDSPTAWDSSSAQSLALHVRAISARAWQLVLQMKLTRVYSASLMACFSPLPKQQPNSLQGTCCLLIFNLLQAYVGILPLSSAASAGPPAYSAPSAAEEMIPISSKSGHDLPMCCSWASQTSSTISPWRALSLLVSDLLSAEHWAGFWWAVLQVAVPGKGACWRETAEQFFCYHPLELAITVMRAFEYLWYPMCVCDQWWLWSACWSIDGMCISPIYMMWCDS